MRYLLALAAILFTTIVSAEQPNGLDERATEETARRGADVEPLGVIQAGPDVAVRKAFAPPADDSDKWWVNVIVAGANATDKEKAASKLLVDDIHALKFKCYVKPEDPASSWAQYQERREDDPLQQDWLAPIRPKLKEVGLPAVVIQPPRNGQFGPNNRTVCVVGQYDGRPDVFSQLIRQRVEAYIYKHAYDGSIAAAAMPAGHKQSEPVGARPPFNLPEPIAYPDAKDLPKQSLTFEQIRKRFPKIPVDAAADYADAQLTAEEIEEAEKQHEVDSKPANPTQPLIVQSPSWDLTPISILLAVPLVLLGVWLITKYAPKQTGSTSSETG